VAQTPGGTARTALEREFPGVGVLEHGERVRAVFGRPMTRATTARKAMEDWMDLYQPVFGVEGLEWVETRGAEISGGRIAFALRQEVTVEGGILTEPTALPVEGGRLRALVTPDGEGFAVNYVAARVADTAGGVAPPQITGEQAIAAAGRDERTRHLQVWSEPRLVVVEMDLGAGPEVFAAWRLGGQESEEAFNTALVVHVDAVTGEVVSARSALAGAGDPVTGTVEGKATSGLGPPLPSTATTQPLPDLIVSIVGESSTTTDLDGDYELETTSSSVDVETALDAGWWTVYDGIFSQSPPSLLLQDVTPPASGQDFLFPDGSLTDEKVALVNSHLNVQKANHLFRRFVANWEPAILPELPSLAVRANLDCSGRCFPFFHVEIVYIGLCVALLNGEGTQDCYNSAVATIVTHEYGHYIAEFVVQEPWEPGDAFHEGYADSLAELVHDTDTIGQDWMLPTPSYLRKPGASPVTYPACTGGEHDRGELLGRIWWDIRMELDDPPPDPPDNTRLLFVRWSMMTNGAAPAHSSCSLLKQPADTGTLIEVLIADDDDNQISNGTPNDLEICAAFAGRDINTQFTGTPCPPPLRGGSTCRADLNYDGKLDIFDFLEFERMFVLGDSFCDFTGDGELDFFDFLAFQAEYAAGCW
jgi:hypothetical protein